MPHADNDDLTLSPIGLALIVQFEGFEPDWYDDPVGIRTIGYGWTGTLPDGLTPPLTEAEARQLLADTVGAYERAVRRHVDVPLAQEQFDALVSFTYNVGASNLAASTLLLRLNDGLFADAAAEFDRWVLAQGQRLEGLVRRRAAERALFESATVPSPPPTPPPVPPPPPPPTDPPPSAPPRTDPMERIPIRPPSDLGGRDLPDLPTIPTRQPPLPGPPSPDRRPPDDDRPGW